MLPILCFVCLLQTSTDVTRTFDDVWWGFVGVNLTKLLGIIIIYHFGLILV